MLGSVAPDQPPNASRNASSWARLTSKHPECGPFAQFAQQTAHPSPSWGVRELSNPQVTGLRCGWPKPCFARIRTRLLRLCYDRVGGGVVFPEVRGAFWLVVHGRGLNSAEKAGSDCCGCSTSRGQGQFLCGRAGLAWGLVCDRCLFLWLVWVDRLVTAPSAGQMP